MNDIAKKMDAIWADKVDNGVVKESRMDWETAFYVFYFEDMKEWSVGVTYRGYEWSRRPEPVAVFNTVELATAFARILNECGLSWLTDNRFTIEVDLAKGVLIA